jgi:hypothetical protein
MARSRSLSRSELLKGIGTWYEIIKALSDGVSKMGGDDRHLRMLIDNRDLVTAVAKVLVPEISNFKVNITGDPLDEILAAVPYKQVQAAITADHFPRTRVIGVVPVVLVRLYRTAETTDVLKVLRALGMEPAATYDLACFIAQHPRLEGLLPIAALESDPRNFHSRELVSKVWRVGGELNFDLCTPYRTDWDGAFRFLAFPSAR